jgi:hypothetical protein
MGTPKAIFNAHSPAGALKVKVDFEQPSETITHPFIIKLIKLGDSSNTFMFVLNQKEARNLAVFILKNIQIEK